MKFKFKFIYFIYNIKCYMRCRKIIYKSIRKVGFIKEKKKLINIMIFFIIMFYIIVVNLC